MSRQLFAPWRDEQAKRNYPFSGQQELIGDADTPLPAGLILDAAIHPPGLTSPVYMESLEVDRGLRLKFTFADTLTHSRIAEGYWPTADAQWNDVVELTTPLVGLAAGLLVISPAEAHTMLSTPSRQIYFSEREASLVLDVCDFTEPAAEAGLEDGQLLSAHGDVYLVGENGIQFTAETATSKHAGETIDVTVLRPHAIGNPLAKRSLCEGDNFAPPRFIQEVIFQKGSQTHRCAPSGLGEIFLVATNLDGGQSALQVYADRDGISFGIIGAGQRGLN